MATQLRHVQRRAGDQRPRAAREDAAPAIAVRRIASPALVAALAFVCFLPVLGNDFVNWDDLHTLLTNPHFRGFSLAHLKWMFTTRYMGHYQPLAWLTHAAVYTFWGLNPVGYHLVNLLLHTANAVLFYFVVAAFLRLRTSHAGVFPQRAIAASAGALFFAIHPLRVEVVAWATERRELLCTFFLLLSLLAYMRMCEERRGEPRARRRWLVLSLAAYVLSLLSKATGLTFPVVLLLLDVYPLRRLGTSQASASGRGVRWAVLIEKIPYGVLAAGTASMAFVAVRETAALPLASYTLGARGLQALYGLFFYVWKTLVPIHLSPLYLLQPLDVVKLRFAMAGVVVAAITVTLIAFRRRYPWALAAWACYVVLVSPVLGLVQSGPQLAADRYTYLSCLPWAVLVAAGVEQLWERAPHLHATLTAGIVLLLGVLGLLTFRQTYVWRNSLTLWNQTLRVEPDNQMAYHNRAHAREDAGDVDGALADYDMAIRLNPLYANAYGGRAHARQTKGDLDGAIADYNASLQLEPGDDVVHNNRGTARAARGDTQGALSDYNEALRLQPAYAEAYCNRGNLRQSRGELDSALADYEACLRLDPTYANGYVGRGNVRQARRDFAGALADFSEAIRLDPKNADAYYNRANVRKATGALDAALEDYTATLRLNPHNASAYNNRGNGRWTKGDVAGALTDFSEAIRVNPRNPSAHYNRGMLRHAQGDLDGALADLEHAVGLAAPHDPRRAMFERGRAAVRQELAARRQVP